MGRPVSTFAAEARIVETASLPSYGPYYGGAINAPCTNQTQNVNTQVAASTQPPGAATPCGRRRSGSGGTAVAGSGDADSD